MKQCERIYENLDLIIFRADDIEGRSVEVAVSLHDYYYLIQHVDKEGKVVLIFDNGINATKHISVALEAIKKIVS